MKNAIKYIAEHYGYTSQSNQLIEEMAELMVAINKERRFEAESDNTVNDYLQAEFLKDNISEEIADVEIMLAQIKHLMNCEDKVEHIKNNKIIRQISRIEKENKTI